MMQREAIIINLQDFYFIRHGETDWNNERRGMGQKDIPINERGLEQAHEAARMLERETIRTICHSPLSRAKVTAEIIGRHLKAPLVEIPGLIECSWGEKEGEIKGKWTEDWRAGMAIPGAEFYPDFLIRAAKAINRSLECPSPVLIVSHGGVFWAIQDFCKLGAHFDLHNGVPVFLRAPTIPNQSWAYARL